MSTYEISISDTRPIPQLAADGWPVGYQVLPENYFFTDSFKVAAVVGLLAVHYPCKLTVEEWEAEAESFTAGGYAVEGTSVIHGAQLVGFSQLTYSRQEGIITNFVVHTGHRGHGIGRAITDMQVALADTLGLTWLGIPRIADSNRLVRGRANYYVDRHGFKYTSEGKLLRLNVPKNSSRPLSLQ